MSRRAPSEIASHPTSFSDAMDAGLFRASCRHVVDGDTYDFLVDLGWQQYGYATVRLRGLDTPELYRPSSPEGLKAARAATASAKEKILDKPVLLRVIRDVDRYGRFVADVLYPAPENGVQLVGSTAWRDLATTLREEGFEKLAN